MAKSKKTHKTHSHKKNIKKIKKSWLLTLQKQIRQNDYYILIGILVLSLILNILLFDSALTTLGDNARYIILGRALARGEGFVNIQSPNNSPEAKFPFVYPLMLAAIELISPNNYLLMKILSLISFLAFLFLLHLFLRQLIEKEMSLLVILFTSMSLPLLEYSHYIMSEIPFLFFSILTLYSFQRSEKVGKDGKEENKEIKKNWWFWISIIAGILSYYTRSFGMMLLGGMFLHILWQRNWRKLIIFSVATFLCWLPWQIRTHILGSSYLKVVVMQNPYDMNSPILTFSTFIERLNHNIGLYLWKLFPSLVIPTYASIIKNANIGFLIFIPINLFLLGGVIYRIKKGISILEFYFVSALFVVMLWPQVWSSMRFIIPIIPFIFYYCLMGLLGLFYLLPNQLKAPAKALYIIIGGLILLSNIIALPQEMQKPRGLSWVWQDYFAVASWLKENTSENAVIMARKPNLSYLYSNRKTFRYPLTNDIKMMTDTIIKRKVTHIIVDSAYFPYHGHTQRYIIPFIKSHPENFTIAYQINDKYPTFIMVTKGFW